MSSNDKGIAVFTIQMSVGQMFLRPKDEALGNNIKVWKPSV